MRCHSTDPGCGERRLWRPLEGWAPVLLLIAAGAEAVAQEGATGAARPIAPQHIRSEEIETLQPAAISNHGRYVAFVAQDSVFPGG